MVSCCFGVFVSGPTFYSLFSMLEEIPPPHASYLAKSGNVWEGVDEDDEYCVLNFNHLGMANYRTAEISQRGPPSFETESLTIRPPPIPIISSMSSPLKLSVTQWPSETNPVVIIEGVSYHKKLV